MDAANHVGPGQDEQVVRAAQVARVVLEALAAEGGLVELVALDHRAHRAVEDQDPLAHQSGQEAMRSSRALSFVLVAGLFAHRAPSVGRAVRSAKWRDSSVDRPLTTYWPPGGRVSRPTTSRSSAAREVADPADFYAPVTSRFRVDPRRTDDPTLNALLGLARPDDVWLDVGAGGGRYALPLALAVREVVAIDPSPSMLAALVEDAAAAGIENVRVIKARWPMPSDPRPSATSALMAHVGYDIAEIGPFLDAARSGVAPVCASRSSASRP